MNKKCMMVRGVSSSLHLTLLCFQRFCLPMGNQSVNQHVILHSKRRLQHHCIATLSTGQRAGLSHRQRPKQALGLAAPVRCTLLTLLTCHMHVRLSWRQLPIRHLLADDLQTGVHVILVHARLSSPSYSEPQSSTLSGIHPTCLHVCLNKRAACSSVEEANYTLLPVLPFLQLQREHGNLAAHL